jgi:hypothetical protein
MKSLAAISVVIFTGIIATAANAAGPEPNPVPGWNAHLTAPTNVRYRHGGYFNHYYIPRNCCVLGPAYGQPGEPLGPAYNTDLWMPNPRTCGPGACQDNPWY